MPSLPPVPVAFRVPVSEGYADEGEAVSAKGTITGNDAADRILREEVPCSEEALRRIIANERNRLIASIRGRYNADPCHECDNSGRLYALLDEIEAKP